MPIYEFYCPACHRLFHFLSRSVNPDARPDCPRCARPSLQRRISAFAVSRGRPESDSGGESSPDGDEARLERGLESLAGEVEGLEDDDPRQAARLMRRLFEATGTPIGSGMGEALRRMEAGEDPDQVEEEMGDVLEEDPIAAAQKKSAGRIARRPRPPTTDPRLYEL